MATKKTKTSPKKIPFLFLGTTEGLSSEDKKRCRPSAAEYAVTLPEMVKLYPKLKIGDEYRILLRFGPCVTKYEDLFVYSDMTKEDFVLWKKIAKSSDSVEAEQVKAVCKHPAGLMLTDDAMAALLCRMCNLDYTDENAVAVLEFMQLLKKNDKDLHQHAAECIVLILTHLFSRLYPTYLAEYKPKSRWLNALKGWTEARTADSCFMMIP